MQIVNSVFSRNQADIAGDAIGAENTSPIVIGSIVWDNVNADPLFGVTSVTWSNIEGGFAGTGNIDADPLFVDPDGADDIAGNEDDDLMYGQGDDDTMHGNEGDDFMEGNAHSDTMYSRPVDYSPVRDAQHRAGSDRRAHVA